MTYQQVKDVFDKAKNIFGDTIYNFKVKSGDHEYDFYSLNSETDAKFTRFSFEFKDKFVPSNRDVYKRQSQTTGTESVTENTEAVKADATEGTENGADGSVSDDDILNSVKQDNEVTFDFDSEEDNSVPVSYITYVIYK